MQLNEIIVWGRSLSEYERMFRLTEADFEAGILGCGDGPASFNAEAAARERRVVSCDPLYEFTAEQIESRVNVSCETVMPLVLRDADTFVWTEFSDPEDLKRRRLDAMRKFLNDFEAGKSDGRYVATALPKLSFKADTFGLALVSHVLFLYSEQLDEAFHLAAIDELLRVAREVRVFPLLDLERRWSPYLESVLKHCRERGHDVEIVATSYEFLRTDDHRGNRMLRVARGS